MNKSFGQVARAITPLFLLCACATPVATDTTFGPQSPKALLVMAGPPADNAFTTEFRRIDLATNQFQDDKIEIVNAGLGDHQINGDTRSGIWLSVQEVPAGDYAAYFVFMVTSVQGGPSNCLNDRALVYSLPAGKITIIRVDETPAGLLTRTLPPTADNAAILGEFASVRTRFPGISGEASIASPEALVRWDEDNQITCDNPKNVRRLR